MVLFFFMLSLSLLSFMAVIFLTVLYVLLEGEIVRLGVTLLQVGKSLTMITVRFQTPGARFRRITGREVGKQPGIRVCFAMIHCLL